jgi:hypothetical protein
MKKTAASSIVFLLFMSLYAQKSSWVTYYPVQDKIIGQMCTDRSPKDLLFSRVPDLTVELETYGSYADFDKTQRKSLLLEFGEIFSTGRLVVKNVYAKHIYSDRIKAENLAYMAPGVPFVYSGLRADSVSIEFKKELNVKANPKAIAEKIKNLFPGVNTYQIETLIATELKDSIKTTLKLTITDPNVYFMIQVATIGFEKMTSLRGAEYVQSFGEIKAGICDKEVKYFTLNSSNPVSCSAKVVIPNGSGAEVGVVLMVLNNKLFIKHQTANLKNTIEKEIVFKTNWSKDALGTFIYRYPFNTSNNRIQFKEIYLFIDAEKTNTDFIILNKAESKNYPTRISYPSSSIIVKRWKQ